MATAVAPITLNELIMLFAGERVPDDQPDDEPDGWATSPSYSIRLAYEIAYRTDPATEVVLRRMIYGGTPVDLIPNDAIDAIKLAYDRYKTLRQTRGL